ncbi:hypothetical protein [Salinibacter ruber]|uniref:Uncharacterized protein n=1 Tax=Salinibacter ruber TaxID=146919 RepID=A0A9X2ZTM8_9BACT|nr:hypothetical protein [Salinibacter ruber]MCS3860106.1 hypothetical protein [Salinibacter ruber]MCS3866934.1 hypothetical protein [Salinibacter ruber]MCS3940284.1 hypothetical protein [Salinibacter ruber]MCS3952762.1 hypothetical protein [Salinibacter ruber]MCS3956411.1 hypothetical protein [Salinibacter ruber]
MGQQQLLLLVLSAVIVGLAVVAGIEAFDRGERQATRDALVQRAMSIGTDILAAHRKSPQLGGINLESDELNEDEIGRAAGLETKQNGAYIDADGAGEPATCDIDHDDGEEGIAFVDCGSKEGGGFTGGFPAGFIVKVRVDPEAEEKVKVVESGEDVSHDNS